MINVRELLTGGDERKTLENYCQQLTQYVVLAPSLGLCRVLGKYLMYVDPLDESLTPHLMLDGYWEMWITMAIANYVRAGMRVIDVGAHVGYYTLLLSDIVGDKGEVIAFEPTDRTRAYLHKNLERNGARNVRVSHQAVSAVCGRATLGISRTNSGTNGLWDLNAPSEPACGTGFREATQPVETVSLDGVIGPPVQFIKIDAEGNEFAVWLGMQEIIEHSPSLQIAMEYGHKYDTEGKLVRAIADAGFSLHEILTNGGLSPSRTPEQIAEPCPEGWRMLWLRRA
jgi:FkbM family methyltransferase